MLVGLPKRKYGSDDKAIELLKRSRRTKSSFTKGIRS